VSVELYEHQKKALPRIKNGSILCGGTGSGKSITGLAYYFTKECNGSLETLEMKSPKDLYIITTAHKRDLQEWDGECSHFSLEGRVKITVDSWNNIKKYTSVCNAFFIFDEQRVVGYGAWSKAFIAITRNNHWILLSATPGDTWSDYIPVFIANGFYKNKTDFVKKHIVYNRYAKFPQVDHYVNCGRLVRLRQEILVNMRFNKSTKPHYQTIISEYNIDDYNYVRLERKDLDGIPLKNASSYCSTLRKIINSDPDRAEVIKRLVKEHPKTIIFYNFDYELEILRNIGKELQIRTAELNGHKHEPVPDNKYSEWMYLVQYSSGNEAWNCIETNTIIFYSLNYSYRMMIQSEGRIDRLNTPYSDLYYYYIRSNSSIDKSIVSALKRKKKFNERGFYASK